MTYVYKKFCKVSAIYATPGMYIELRIYASVKHTIIVFIVSDNVLSPVAVIWTNASSLFLGPLVKNFIEFWIKIINIFYTSKWIWKFENTVCKIVAILSRPQCANNLPWGFANKINHDGDRTSNGTLGCHHVTGAWAGRKYGTSVPSNIIDIGLGLLTVSF